MSATPAPTIIETLDGAFYRVTETGSADLAHVWNGVRVMRRFGEWVDRKNSRVELVRKLGARVFSTAAGAV
ncbi:MULTISPECIES: hypothetical protein [unclassified Mesorhizobium]|uniref:hypothetical protein n=1 Tax=unclassified Mesorhizobium TaxID=325217 RepID=UPI000FCC3C28|nr:MULTISPECIES: hypothetical protein [unclassified Mesorhizobium]RUV17876.1 hypothetical protein EOA91_18715 [Mesorhizobium sp. M1A.F.Ca.IN.022.04.1.1]RWG27096.1 MAG: hypothetical protein EOQ60_26250 [Mesorhizobium sp.]TIS14193.1 MAG: hypothetical protein E5X10_13420 [Mesorhizobium sp.]